MNIPYQCPLCPCMIEFFRDYYRCSSLTDHFTISMNGKFVLFTLKDYCFAYDEQGSAWWNTTGEFGLGFNTKPSDKLAYEILLNQQFTSVTELVNYCKSILLSLIFL